MSVKVKVCGLTSPEDAEFAALAGADAIGMVFYAKSPRHIADFGLAREIAAAVGPFVSVVALSVNAERSVLESLLSEVPVSLLQFHGDETAVECELYQRPYLKAMRMREGIDLHAEIERFPSSQGILLDTYKKGIPGGTGECFNWDRVPEGLAKPVVLAGGLIPENVAEAVVQVCPYAVDVSGGVEAEPGKKDRQKIRAFIENAKRGECSER